MFKDYMKIKVKINLHNKYTGVRALSMGLSLQQLLQWIENRSSVKTITVNSIQPIILSKYTLILKACYNIYKWTASGWCLKWLHCVTFQFPDDTVKTIRVIRSTMGVQLLCQHYRIKIFNTFYIIYFDSGDENKAFISSLSS